MKLYIVETYDECLLIYADDPEQAEALAIDACDVHELPQAGELARVVGRFELSGYGECSINYKEVK